MSVSWMLSFGSWRFSEQWHVLDQMLLHLKIWHIGEKKWKIQSSVKLTVSIFGKCHLGSFLVVGWKKEGLWCQIHQFLLPSCPWADQRLFSLTQIQLYWTPLFIIKYNYGINIKFKVTFSQVVLNDLVQHDSKTKFTKSISRSSKCGAMDWCLTNSHDREISTNSDSV